MLWVEGTLYTEVVVDSSGSPGRRRHGRQRGDGGLYSKGWMEERACLGEGGG